MENFEFSRQNLLRPAGLHFIGWESAWNLTQAAWAKELACLDVPKSGFSSICLIVIPTITHI
jgi:hypothetical protein